MTTSPERVRGQGSLEGSKEILSGCDFHMPMTPQQQQHACLSYQKAQEESES